MERARITKIGFKMIVCGSRNKHIYLAKMQLISVQRCCSVCSSGSYHVFAIVWCVCLDWIFHYEESVAHHWKILNERSLQLQCHAHTTIKIKSNDDYEM